MRKKVNENQIVSGDITKVILQLAFPTVIFNLFNVTYSLINTFFVSRSNELLAGAISLVSPITSCALAFSTGISVATLAMMSFDLGENDILKARRTAAYGIISCTVIGLVIMAVCYLGKDYILAFLHTPAEIYADTSEYMMLTAGSLLFQYYIAVYTAIRQATGDTLSGVRINIVSTLLSLVLDTVLISRMNMGAKGAGLSVLISKGAMIPFIIYNLFNKKELIHLNLKKMNMDRDTVRRMIRIAIPSIVGSFMANFGFILYDNRIVSFGAYAMSGYSMGEKVAQIFYIPSGGIGPAVAICVGRNLGAGKPERAKEAFTSANRLILKICLVSLSIGHLSAGLLCEAFYPNINPQLMYHCIEYSRFSMLSMPLMGIYNNSIGLFDGSGNTRISMIINISRLIIVRYPLMVLFCDIMKMNQVGIWQAMLASNLTVDTFGIIFFKKNRWYKTDKV